MVFAGVLHIDGVPTECRVRCADTWFRRAIGLLATKDLRDPCGLWIQPCGSVHTLGMRYAIDVVFVDAQGRVLKVVPQLRPWRMAACLGAFSTLELRAGLASALALRTGSTVCIVG